MKKITIALAFLVLGSGNSLFAQTQTKNQEQRWKSGILVDEFIYEKAPFPQCHAATIAETPKGLIAAFFGGTRERNPDVCIWVSRLVNNKWTEPVNVANGIVNDTLRYATWNPVLYQVPGGDLMLFYKTGPKVSAWKGWVKTSKDHGLTWSEAQALPEGMLGPVKNKPVMLKDGTIIAPSSTEGDGWKLHFEVSKDKGKTWTKVGPINDGKTFNAIQPSILIHKDGKLQVLARSKERAIIETWSSDNGQTWTPLAKSNLPNNNSGTDAVTLKDGRHLLVYNHVYPHDTLKNGKGPRTPLNVSVSKDGEKWYAALILEDSPISQYSYPSVIQSKDGMVHIVYTWRRERIKYVKVDPSKLKLTEIKGVEWPGGVTVQAVAGKPEEE
jgi:predicted neuraminidase